MALSGGGYQGIARALCELTGLPAGIEDKGGALLAWAAPGAAPPLTTAKPPAREWNDLIEQSLRTGRPAQGDGRLLAAVRVRHDAVGVLYLVDPQGVAGEDETIALEHGSTVLAIELARLLSVAETELRLGVDVLADLVGGTGVAAAVRRAEALGRDLSRPQRVVIVGVHRSRVDPDVLLHAVRGAAESPHPLLMHRGETVVALLEVRSVHDRASVDALAAGLRATRVGRSLELGVGGVPRRARRGRRARSDAPEEHRTNRIVRAPGCAG